MKSFLFAFLFLFVPKLAISQISENDEISYVDSLGMEGTFETQQFLRVIKDLKIPNKEPYEIKEYYKSGKLAMTGSIIPSKNNKRVGSFTSFYENGSKKSIEIYNEGNLKSKYDFYEKGQKKMVSEYLFNSKQLTSEKKITQFWNEDGIQKIIDGNGFFEIKEEEESEKGELKNSLKNGIWEGHQYDITYKETYENGKLISGISTDKNLETYMYTDIETKPVPKKGMENFYSFIGRNFNYTEESIKNNILGKILLKFVVDKDGQIIEPKIIRGLGYGLDEEAIRVLLKYGNWVPGIQRGRKVRCSYIFPLNLQASR